MKTAVFLDVDRTLTTDFIQHIYAKELGVENEYQKLEDDFQLGLHPNKEKAVYGISSAQFGARLSKLFGDQKFTRAKAEDLFSKVELVPDVDDLFKLQQKGIAIYLVSSGPNYYIDVLAERNGIPPERVKSSIYHFDEKTGIIDKCNSVNAQDKQNFVRTEIDKYDLTIGVGDCDRHDAFVSLCTISMYTTMQKDYIQLTEFRALARILENLSKISLNKTISPLITPTVITPDTLTGVTLPEVLKKFSAGLWLIIGSVIVATFGIGYAAHNIFMVKN